MATEPLITAANLRDALSLPTYLALFDDELTGSVTVVDASAGVALVLRRAHIRCISWLGTNYNKLPRVTDTEVPDLLIDAELNFAVALAYDRHPEYTRSTGCEPNRKSAFDQAETCMMRIQEAILRLDVDAPSMGAPLNVGGIVTDGGQRVFLGSTNGASNGGDF